MVTIACDIIGHLRNSTDWADFAEFIFHFGGQIDFWHSKY